MSVSFTLRVRNGQTTQIVATPGSPIPESKLAKILEEMERILEDPTVYGICAKPFHKHDFEDFPFYSFGELVSIIRRCTTCGHSVRELP